MTSWEAVEPRLSLRRSPHGAKTTRLSLPPCWSCWSGSAEKEQHILSSQDYPEADPEDANWRLSANRTPGNRGASFFLKGDLSDTPLCLPQLTKIMTPHQLCKFRCEATDPVYHFSEHLPISLLTRCVGDRELRFARVPSVPSVEFTLWWSVNQLEESVNCHCGPPPVGSAKPQSGQGKIWMASADPPNPLADWSGLPWSFQ